jgi:UDP-2,4-diacetamido-2,4,6-trideoxy-beta-L-altropyranose hydrolase
VKVVFRADASVDIGNGHVMRCLALAKALLSTGMEVHFVCRELVGHLGPLIQHNNIHLHLLPPPEKDAPLYQYDDYNSWLSVPVAVDVEQVKKILRTIHPDWLVVDHYALNYVWQNKLRSHCGKIMAIDDLANRAHSVDALLDQTFNRNEKDYLPLLPEGSDFLLGIDYVLLREEFDEWREYSLKRRVKCSVSSVLIMMGGVDKENYTGKVLLAMEKLSACDFSVTVILGGATNQAKIHEMLDALSYDVKVLTSVNNVAEVMSNQDLIIGASGTSTWERCCLGVPSLQFVVAENQTKIANELVNIGAVITADLASIVEDVQIAFEYKEKMSIISSAVVRSSGVANVVNCIKQKPQGSGSLSYSIGSHAHCEFVYGLQDEKYRQYSVTKDSPSLVEHKKWFARMLKSNNSVLLVLCFNDLLAGFLRLDDVKKTDVTISLVVSESYQKKGLASFAINLAVELLVARNLVAFVHYQNVASNILFTRKGFTEISREGDFLRYEYQA